MREVEIVMAFAKDSLVFSSGHSGRVRDEMKVIDGGMKNGLRRVSGRHRKAPSCHSGWSHVRLKSYWLAGLMDCRDKVYRIH